LTTYSGSAPLDNVQIGSAKAGSKPAFFYCPILRCPCLRRECMFYDTSIDSCAIYSIHKSLDYMCGILYETYGRLKDIGRQAV
jgi:hypothetical protein